jgi:DNA polymerase/3'-5' exonuclease PolX
MNATLTASSIASAKEDKPRWPRAAALRVALALEAALRPHCHRIQIAGSLRREKPTVGDIELVYIPRIDQEPDPASLLSDLMEVNLVDTYIAALERTGVLARRLNCKGVEMFGPQNKLMIHNYPGIPVDLFATTAESWFNYLVCRTGGAENNVAIAQAAIARGEQWNPYGPGFTRRNGYKSPMRSEEEVFAFVGLPFLPPNQRT